MHKIATMLKKRELKKLWRQSKKNSIKETARIEEYYLKISKNGNEGITIDYLKRAIQMLEIEIAGVNTLPSDLNAFGATCLAALIGALSFLNGKPEDIDIGMECAITVFLFFSLTVLLIECFNIYCAIQNYFRMKKIINYKLMIEALEKFEQINSTIENKGIKIIRSTAKTHFSDGKIVYIKSTTCAKCY